MKNFNTLIYNLKSLMEHEKLSQDDIAKISCVNQATVSRWLTGKRIPTLENLLNISEHFDISLDELLGLREFKT